MSTKALLTGSRGFCGRRLRSLLESKGVDVVSVGFYDAPASGHIRLRNSQDIDPLADALGLFRPDYFFHLAGAAPGTPTAEAHTVNVSYAETVLRAFEIARCEASLLLVGSSAEYGAVGPNHLPLKEEAPCRPIGDYGITKLAQTELGLKAAGRGIKVTVARPFNVIGPSMPEHVALGSFVAQLRRLSPGDGEAQLRVGNLKSERDFVDVDDAMESYWQLANHTGARGQLINVCSGNPTSMQVLVEALLARLTQKVTLVPDPARLKASDVPVSYGSTVKLHRLVTLPEWTPLARTLDKIVRADLPTWSAW